VAPLTYQFDAEGLCCVFCFFLIDHCCCCV